jgi:hypothetical protein
MAALHVALFLRQPDLERAQPSQRGGEIRKTLERLDAERGRRWLEPGHRRLRCGPDILRPQHRHQALRRSRKIAVPHGRPRDRLRPESNRRGLRGSQITGVQQRCDIVIAGV